MARKASVTLDLDAAKYLREAASVSVATKAVDEEMKGLGRASDAAGRDMDQLAVQAELAKKGLGGVGTEARETTVDLTALRARIDATKASITTMNTEWAKTGDDKIRGQIRQETSLLRELERAAKDLGGATKAVRLEVPVGDTRTLNAELTRTRALVQSLKGQVAANISLIPDYKKEKSRLKELESLAVDVSATGAKVGASFASSIGSAFDGLGPHVKAIAIGALVTAAVAASPAIAAVIGGAVTLGVGTIGLAGGIFAATHDPAVQAAIMDFQGSVSTMFFNSAGSFVGPLVNALGILKTGFRDLDLKSTFALAAPYVTILAKGIADMGREFMPRFRDALKGAGPAIAVMAQQLPRVGAALGDMLKRMAESKGTVQGVQFLFGLLSGSLRAVGEIVGWLSDRFFDLNSVMASVTGRLADFFGDNPIGRWFGDGHDLVEKFINQAKNLPPVMDEAAVALEDVRAQMRVTGDATSELVGKTKNLYDTTMSLARANLDLKQKMADLKQSFEDNGKTLDVNTQKGRDNWRATLDSVDAAKAKYDADVALGQNMETARLIYEANIKKIQEQAAAAHASADQVQTLTDKLNQVPHLTLAELRLQFEQSGTLLGEHSGLRKNELNPPATPKPLARNTGRGNRWGGAYTHAADGALRQADVYSAQSPARYAFAEPATGGEAFVPKVGDYARSMDILQTAAGWYGARIAPKWEAAQPPGSWQSAGGMGGGTTRFELVVSTAPGADQRVMAAITEGLRFDIDTKSAGDVQAHLTRRR